MPSLLPADLVDFLESGVSILVGTRSSALRPHCLRAGGARVHEDRCGLTVLLPDATAGVALENLRDNGLVALTFSRPSDHQGIQLKGRVTATRTPTDHERQLQDRYRAAFFEQLHFVGMARAVARRFAFEPATAVDVAVESIFLQTPGPGAGRRLGDDA